MCPVCNIHVDAVDPATGKIDNLFNTNLSEKKRKKRINERERTRPAELQSTLDAAVARKDRLVHFDRTQRARSTVYDDQSDYFERSSDAWLSATEKAQAKEKDERRRNASKRSAQPFSVSVDLAGRRVMRAATGNDVDAAREETGSSHLDGRARAVYEIVSRKFADDNSRSSHLDEKE